MSKVFAGILVGGMLSAGQGRSVAPLKSLKNLRCSFTASAAGDWQRGEPEVRVRSATLTLTISKIDLDEETATIAGPDGAASVTAKLSGSNLFFLDLRSGGAALLTTVFAQESKDRKLKAVHTRTAPDVAQFYGDCEILP